MDWFARWFIKASLVWLCIGVTFGVAMAVHPPWTIYRPAHMHATLFGFVTMMIYGVGYHVLPRFAGSQLRSRELAGVHWWIANVGLAAMIIGFGLRVSTRVPVAAGTAALVLGGLLSAAGAFAFSWNMWKTIDDRERVRARRRAKPLPTLEMVGR